MMYRVLITKCIAFYTMHCFYALKGILLVFFKGHKSSTETFNCLNVHIAENALFFGGLENACANI